MESSRRPVHGLTATTLVVLVAVGSAAAMVSPLAPGAEARAARHEGHTMRLAAAAVVAVARDLIGADHCGAALPSLSPSVTRTPQAPEASFVDVACATAPSHLDERLLDLPPPAL